MHSFFFFYSWCFLVQTLPSVLCLGTLKFQGTAFFQKNVCHLRLGYTVPKNCIYLHCEEFKIRLYNSQELYLSSSWRIIMKTFKGDVLLSWEFVALREFQIWEMSLWNHNSQTCVGVKWWIQDGREVREGMFRKEEVAFTSRWGTKQPGGDCKDRLSLGCWHIRLCKQHK